MKKNNFQYKEYKILDKKEVAPNTFLFILSGKLNFMPGQFVQTSLDHYGEATFAPCNNPRDKRSFDLCIRAAGSTTDKMVELTPGDKLKIRGPYGNAWPVSKMIGKNILIVAGGIGLVPLRPLLYELLEYRSEFKKIILVTGFKSDHHIVFKEDIQKWKKNLSSLEIMVEHSSTGSDSKQGLVTKAIEKLNLDFKKTITVMCGPEIMCDFCNKMLLDKGQAEESIYISFERRMECGIGVCQHCNIGKYLVCEDGPIFSLKKIKNELNK